jgi:pimeloyl-ACP methyl ester carboxylesterase
LLLTLRLGTHFDAIVAECPYSSFQRVAFDRVVQPLRKLLPGHIADWVSNLWVAEIILYLRLRYRLDLSLARPVNLAREARMPVLLIHGTADFETPAHHSEEIAAANQEHFKLWLVAGAKHTGAYAVAPDEFEKRVLAHFAGQS